MKRLLFQKIWKFSNFQKTSFFDSKRQKMGFYYGNMKTSCQFYRKDENMKRTHVSEIGKTSCYPLTDFQKTSFLTCKPMNMGFLLQKHENIMLILQKTWKHHVNFTENMKTWSSHVSEIGKTPCLSWTDFQKTQLFPQCQLFQNI